MSAAATEEERRKQRVAIEEAAVIELRRHMAAEDYRLKKELGWHVGKEIPIATIIVLILQTAGVVWWAATTSAELKAQKDSIAATQAMQMSVDRRQDDEAQRSESRIVLQLGMLNQKLDRLIEKR